MSGLQLHEPKTSVVCTSFGVRVFGLNLDSCNPIGPSHYGDLRYRCTLQVRLQHLRIFLHQFNLLEVSRWLRLERPTDPRITY